MSRRRRQRQTEQKPATAPADASRDRLRPWLLGGMTALFVARPLFPSDSPGCEGDGLPVVMLWIALLLFWMLGAIGRPAFRIRFGWTDAAVLLLIALHTLAAVVAAVRGSPRPAVNSLWEWIGLGLAFFLARQFVVGRRETRAVLAVMIALAVGLSGYGLHQHFYSLPNDRLAYEQDPEGMLRAAGWWYPEGSPERQSFENRLRTSGPVATFALANSLAGFLAPWLAVLAGIAVGGLSRKRLVGIICCALPIVACLLLTKSRSGCVAAAVGLVLAWLWCRERRVRIGWRIPAAVVGLLVALLVAGAAAGWLNQDAFGRAQKSFGYRLQYWQSSAEMIADHPLLGCGPGNFQNEYTRYKLPEASEEVSDPHNFLLEVWATAGTPAALALLAALGCFAWALRRGGKSGPPENVAEKGERRKERGEGRGAKGEGESLTHRGANPFASPPPQADAPAFVLLGAAAGVLLAWPLALLGDSVPAAAAIAIGLILAVGAVVLLWDWICEGCMPRLLPAVGVVVLLVDLLAAGGIGFASVAGMLWLLLALGLNTAEDGLPAPGGDGRILPRAAALAGLVLAITLAVTCYVSAYDPVLRCHGLMEAARRELAENRAAEAEKYLQAAAKADPLAADPWRQLANLALRAWRRHHRDSTFDQLERYNEALAGRAVNSAPAWAAIGESYQTVFSDGHKRWNADRRAEIIAKAAAAYQRAVELYPNSPLYRARLALAYRDAGDDARFREEARIALDLDETTPHEDKKLGRLRERLADALGD